LSFRAKRSADAKSFSSFDSIAPLYRALEILAFGNALHFARVAFVDKIGSASRALIAGEGNGRFLEALLRRHPTIRIDCVDASARMLQLAKARVHDNPRVRFLHEDLKVWSPDENSYDLIVTHFFLDCFTEQEVRLIVAKLAQAATSGAIWLLSDFAIPLGGVAKLHALAWLGAMYRFFRLTTRIGGAELIDPSPFLCAHEFRLSAQTLSRFGLIKAELWHR
jgi:ubiquinone/menaquinone biosynthesis C-methylase UbiE